MLRTMRHAASRITFQTCRRPQTQLRYLQQDRSKLPLGKDVKSSDPREHIQSAPMNMSHFRALVEQPDPVYQKRYRRRWDWHLRNFLMALMPPGALLICIKLIEWSFREDMEEYGHLFPTAGHLRRTLEERRRLDAIANKDQGDLSPSFNEKLLQRIDLLEKEIQNLQSQYSVVKENSRNQEEALQEADQQALMKAQKICKTMVRQKRDSG